MRVEPLPAAYDRFKGTENDLGDGLTTAELFFWAEIKRKEMLEHRSLGHAEQFGFCRMCDNCLCPWNNRFKCRCAEGKRQVTPYRIRFSRRRDAERAGMRLPEHV